MMNFRKILHLSLALLSVLFLTLANAAEKPGSGKNDKQSLGKVSGTPTHQILNINNITTWGRSDGESNHSPSADNGVYYPVGTGNVVYEDGIVFGSKQFLDAAKKNPSQGQKIRVGGSTYLSNVGNKAGYVTGVGASAKAASPDAPDVRYYKVRRDYFYMTDPELQFDAYTRFEHSKQADVTQSEMDAVKAQYDTDWKNWPVALGAPYIERNGKPGYQAPPVFGPNFTVDSLVSGKYDEPGVGDPNTPADQVMWTAYNDLDKAQSLRFEGSESQGIELQVTTWGYKRTDAMGNCYFKRVKFTNKGGVDLGNGTFGAFYLDSMYVCQWSDIDLGDAADDLAGCDSARSMGFVYNGNPVDKTFTKFGLPPPSSGYDFLAGPTITSAGDSAVVDFKRVYGKKNLPMSGFSYFSAGSPYTDPGFANYPSGTGQWWNMLRGYAPLGTITDPPVVYAYPATHYPTKFPLSGDPTKGIVAGNFVDGAGTSSSFVMGDRRILLNTGPFTLDPGESQELYVGFVVGIGADRLSSVSVMKASDNAVQQTFDLLFKVAKAPAAPVVKFTEMDGEVILDWGNNAAAVLATETKIAEPGSYTFEGYNVYQFPSAGSTLANAKRIATYDVVNDIKVVLNDQFDLASGAFLKIPIQFGSDAGVKRLYRFSQDNIRDVAKLYNGQAYYLGVTAYSVTAVPGYIAALESSPGVITVIPKVPFGKVFTAKFGDTLKVTVGGASDGKAVPLVINPGALTGDTYKVTFDDTKTPTEWSIIDVTKANKVMLSGQTNQSGDDNYLFVDGMMVKIIGPNPGMLSFAVPSGTRRISPVGGFIGLGLEGFSNAGDATAYDVANGTIGMAGHLAFGGIGTTLKPADYHSVLLKFAPVPATLWDPKAATQSSPNYSKSYRYLRAVGTTSTPADPSFAPWIINKASGYPYQDYNYAVPFSAWDIDVTPPVRLSVGNFENNVVGGLIDGRYYPGLTSVDNSVPREFAFIFSAPYTETPNPLMAANISNNATMPLMWVMTCARRNDPPWADGDNFQINAGKLNTSKVTYNFTSPAPLSGADQDAISAAKIGVFPNPYYASNTAETSRFDRFVTFNNLPKNAVIRIFSIAGHLVRTLNKSTDSQFMRWDLMNARNYPVASGVYIAYIELPDIGVTKTVKFSVIQQQEVLDYY
ncbi:MAG: hypothetical protein NTU47_07680 [Ignavibacteriales bacterium]|nr:hypothetical protein [Ignavibacteriales bacterium]